MTTKQNMYIGRVNNAEKIIEEINNCVLAWKLNESGIHEIVIYDSDKADAIRDAVSNMQGQLEVLIEGLDKKSPRKKEYQHLLDKINMFLKLYK